MSRFCQRLNQGHKREIIPEAVSCPSFYTTNSTESTFAIVRLRTLKAKGCGSRIATLTMIFNLTMEATKTWKKLKGHKLILLVLENKKFVDGELIK